MYIYLYIRIYIYTYMSICIGASTQHALAFFTAGACCVSHMHARKHHHNIIEIDCPLYGHRSR